jgi:hypothetical protein
MNAAFTPYPRSRTGRQAGIGSHGNIPATPEYQGSRRRPGMARLKINFGWPGQLGAGHLSQGEPPLVAAGG